MTRSPTHKPRHPDLLDAYDVVLRDVTALLEGARRAAARSVNAVMTTTYFALGRRLVEEEQRGQARAGYGDALVERLATDLSARFGRGFGRRNLFQMRAFYLAYQERVQTLSAPLPQSGAAKKVQTASALSTEASARVMEFPLPWSHYARLLSVRDPAARAFYETEALRGGWTRRQLDRQIGSQFYERTMLSRNKAAMLRKGEVARPDDAVTPEEEIKDPVLLELGGDFAFVGRQRRLRIGDAWYRVDLLFFHRRLHCLVIIDLKLGAFTHADAGQMHLYLNYAREHWVVAGENPPVGLILCAEKDAAVARYALEGLPNQVLAAEYRTMLPAEGTLAAEVRKARRLVERTQR
jgi:predicted nuclease of restriction endonuclease-like (RecB) superfamily